MSPEGSHAQPALETEAPATEDAISALARQSTPWYARPAVIGVVAFLALLIIKFDTLSEPPAWDAAMSVHPAAITLAETGFDYPALLASPGYADGGPNTHSTSLYTAFAAFVYWLFAPATALVILHLSTFLVGALTAVGLVRFARHFLSPGQAVWAAAAAMAMPLVLTQFGMVYLEAPVLAATTWALVAAIERRWIATAGFSLLATGIKPSGAITAGALALFYLLERRSAAKALAILGPSAILLSLQTIASPGFVDFSLRSSAHVANFSWWYLATTPDLLLVLLIGILSSGHLVRRRPNTVHNELGTMLQTFALSFIVFYAGLMNFGFTTLPRYYTQIAPLAIATILVATHDRHGSKAFKWAASALLVSSAVLNFNGAIYPGESTNNFALAERSDAYDQLLALEIAATSALCELSVEAPVWYSKPEAYRLQYPQMGYADCEPRGQAIQREVRLDLRDLPETLFVAFEYPWLGGGSLHELVSDAEASPDWTVGVAKTVAEGDFHQDIYRLTRIKGG